MELVLGGCRDAAYFGGAKVAMGKDQYPLTMKRAPGFPYRIASTRLNCRASRRSGVA
jgi:hypothetical protein